MTKDLEDALLAMHGAITAMGNAMEVLMLQHRNALETNEEDIIDGFCNHMQKATEELERLVP